MKKTLLSLAAVAALSMSVAVPAQAATQSNGINLNGFTVNGINLNGFTVNGFSFNGFTLNGIKWNGQAQTGGAIDVCEPTTANTCAPALRAIVLPNGERVTLR